MQDTPSHSVFPLEAVQHILVDGQEFEVNGIGYVLPRLGHYAFVEHRVDPPRSYRANPIAAIRPAFGHDVELAIRARGATAPNFEVLDLDVVFGEHQVENATKRSEEHTSELQSLMRISFVFCCLKKK